MAGVNGSSARERLLEPENLYGRTTYLKRSRKIAIDASIDRKNFKAAN